MFLPNPFRQRQAIRPVNDSPVWHDQVLADALSLWADRGRFSALAVTIGRWAVRRLGADKASSFVDAIVAAAQAESRKQ